MSDGECRFTSDRRGREEASWVGQADWEAGTVENVDVTTDGLVGRRPDQTQYLTKRRQLTRSEPTSLS